MTSYFGSKISDNIALSPEGFLVCQNVPIGRAGWMKYRQNELQDLGISAEWIDVYRSPDEIFSKKTMASFEGKPFTDNHPSSNVDVDNVSYLSKGHIQNVRRKDDDMIADIIVTDKKLIDDIQRGKRDVSSGYECLWTVKDYDKAQVEQSEITGNHVALVIKGRAGDRISIQDSAPKPEEGGNKLKLKNIKKGTAAFLGLKLIAKDGTDEDFEKALEVEMGDMDPEPEKKEVMDMEEEPGSEAIKALTEKVDALTAIVEALVKTDEKVHEEMGADEIFGEMEKEETEDGCGEEYDADMEPMGSEVIEPVAENEEGETEIKIIIGDSGVYAAAKAAIMAIPDEKIRNEAAKTFRQKAVDSAPQAKPNGGYGGVVKNKQSHKRQAADKAAEVDAQKVAVDNWKNAGKNLRGVE